MDELSIKTFDENQTLKLGQTIGSHLKGGELICLNGNLGSGKTTLTKAILSGAGVKTGGFSPTFVVDAVYTTKGRGRLKEVHHLDLYRLRDEKELITLGLDEILSDSHSSVVIEWADLFPIVSDKGALSINIVATKPHVRVFEIKASGEDHQKLLTKIEPLIKNI